MNTKLKASSRDLFADVIDAGLCTFCGACSGGCPYLVPYLGRIRLLDNCTLSEGQCYRYCPRTFTDMDEISRFIFGKPYEGSPLGNYREVFMARSKDPDILSRAQYGGVVTTLLALAMAEGIIDSAVLSRMSADKVPGAFLANNPEEVLQCAGSGYLASPVLEALNRIPADSAENVGVVTTPCQGLALAKMRKDPPRDRFNTENIKLVVGLFCTWALSPDTFYGFLSDKLDLKEVTRFDIPPPPANRFDVFTPSGKVSFPLEKVREFVIPSCAYCLDMTSEFADVSVGSVEGIEGWNTVIVRTEAGAGLIEKAEALGKLEIDRLPPLNLAHLEEAALLKKKRALEQIITRTGSKSDLLYLELSESTLSGLLD